MASSAAISIDPQDGPQRQPERLPMRELEVILKVAERCNLVCSYCYYFFSADQSYALRPARASRDVIDGIAKFLADGAAALQLPSVKIVFHGGEPLLLRKADFVYACEAFRSSLSPVTKLRLAVQTNGILIDQEWAEIFLRYDMIVGISIDGDAEINDRHRIDRRGRGSHSRIVDGLRLVQEAGASNPRFEPGLLTVLDAGNDIRRVYKHFVDELGAKDISTLLPDCSHDDGIPDGRTAEEYGLILCELFDMWTESDGVYLREIHSLLARFEKSGRGMWRGRRNPVVVIQSDGTLSMDDSYVPAQAWRDRMPKGNIYDDRLSDWLWNDAYRELDELYGSMPTGCKKCVWRNICRGGDLENRYSSDGGFDNPSVFCEGLKIFYLHVTKHLVRNGYPTDEVLSRLGV